VQIHQQPANINVEEFLNEFVEGFGGELVSKILDESLAGKGKRPDNADYFLFNRGVVAELKCLEKNYLNNKEIGRKLTDIINRWSTLGLLRPEHIKNGSFQTDDLPIKCRSEIFKVFSFPVQTAVKKANKQIKETKRYFGIPNAKGLLILANDGNYSINPKLMMQILGNLLKSSYTGIDSVIFFTPNLRAYAPQIDRQFNVWISGRSRPSSNSVEPELLHKISEAYISFVEKKFGEPVTRFETENHSIIEDIKLVGKI
jgi:hypothetical protein